MILTLANWNRIAICLNMDQMTMTNSSTGQGEDVVMSLVMAVICTDGIVVSGDFRRSRYVKDTETGETKFEYYDDQHKIFRTSQNRIVGTTGGITLQTGESIKDALNQMLQITDDMKLSIQEEFGFLISVIGDEKISLIEAGIENGKGIVFIYTPTSGIEIGTTGGAIGATDELKKHEKGFDLKIKEATTTEVKSVLSEYNELTALSDPTVSRGCEFLTIT